MSPLEILTKARAKIEDPKHWCQGDYVDKNGAFCAVGAIDSVLSGRESTEKFKAIDILYNCLKKVDKTEEGIVGYNDSHTHKEVLNLFDKAIKKAAKQ